MMILLLSLTLAIGPAAEAATADRGAATPTTCDHAINTKGTGTSGRSAGTDMAINTKGTGAAGRTAATEMAIKTKGTGAQRTALAIKTKGTSAQRTALAIKTKGTSAQRVTAAAGGADCDDSDSK